MKEKLLKSLNFEKSRLDKGEIESIKLIHVYPSIIEEVFGEASSDFETNGWECDYWFSNEKYRISGCMYYGTATITKNKGDE